MRGRRLPPLRTKGVAAAERALLLVVGQKEKLQVLRCLAQLNIIIDNNINISLELNFNLLIFNDVIITCQLPIYQ